MNSECIKSQLCYSHGIFQSIVNYEDDYEDIDLVSAQRHSTSSGKRRSDQYTSLAGYSHKDRGK